MKKLICIGLATTLLLAGCATGKPSSTPSTTTSSTTPSSTTTSSTPPTAYTMIFLHEYAQRLREEMKAKASNKPFDELARIEYDPEDIFPRLCMFRPSNINTIMDYFLEEFPTECIRVPDNAAAYTVHKLKDGWRLYSFFTDCFFLDYAFVVKDLPKWSDFSTISAGSTMTDVENVDAGTKLYHTYAEGSVKYRLNFTKRTCHLVEEGLVCIEYNGETNTEGVYPDLSSYTVKSITLYPFGEPVPGALFAPYRDPAADKINFKLLKQDMP